MHILIIVAKGQGVDRNRDYCVIRAGHIGRRSRIDLPRLDGKVYTRDSKRDQISLSVRVENRRESGLCRGNART